MFCRCFWPSLLFVYSRDVSSNGRRNAMCARGAGFDLFVAQAHKAYDQNDDFADDFAAGSYGGRDACVD